MSLVSNPSLECLHRAEWGIAHQTLISKTSPVHYTLRTISCPDAWPFFAAFMCRFADFNSKIVAVQLRLSKHTPT
jgi:hypothetical protein